MKKFSYSNNSPIIRKVDEIKSPKKRFSKERITFLVVLGLLAFFSLNFLYKKAFIIEANGFVRMKKVDVNFTKDIRIKYLKIKEGDTVRVNQELFTYVQDEYNEDDNYYYQNKAQKQKNVLLKENLKKEKTLKNIEIENLKKRKKLKEKEVKETEKLVILDVYPREKLKKSEEELNEIVIELELAQSEKDFINSKIADLLPIFEEFAENSKRPIVEYTYFSSADGVIGKIYKNNEETCYKSEKVVTIHDESEIYINAYFESRYADFIHKDLIVDIEFPDGKKAKGNINKIFINAALTPKELSARTEEYNRKILAEIIPLTDSDKELWDNYHNLNIKVSINRIL